MNADVWVILRLRLYALAIGSWLYRMDYGFWVQITDGMGHTDTFRGPFDYVMDFAFYLPNLVVAELYLRRKSTDLPPWVTLGMAMGMAMATESPTSPIRLPRGGGAALPGGGAEGSIATGPPDWIRCDPQVEPCARPSSPWPASCSSAALRPALAPAE